MDAGLAVVAVIVVAFLDKKAGKPVETSDRFPYGAHELYSSHPILVLIPPSFTPQSHCNIAYAYMLCTHNAMFSLLSLSVSISSSASPYLSPSICGLVKGRSGRRRCARHPSGYLRCTEYLLVSILSAVKATSPRRLLSAQRSASCSCIRTMTKI